MKKLLVLSLLVSLWCPLQAEELLTIQEDNWRDWTFSTGTVSTPVGPSFASFRTSEHALFLPIDYGEKVTVDRVELDATLPPDTSIWFFYRTGDDESGKNSSSFSHIQEGDGDRSGQSDSPPPGRFLFVTIQLRTSTPQFTPVLHSVVIYASPEGSTDEVVYTFGKDGSPWSLFSTSSPNLIVADDGSLSTVEKQVVEVATLESSVFDLGKACNIDRIEWEASIPAGHRLEVQTKTPVSYVESVVTVYHDSNGNEITESKYNKLPKSKKGAITEESRLVIEEWTDWSAPYLSSGQAFPSPLSTRHLQVRITFIDEVLLADNTYLYSLSFFGEVNTAVEATSWGRVKAGWR